MSKFIKTKFINRRLPPLNALRAFEAAGRLQSLTAAAAELNVTPAAVGHQVKQLEQYFEHNLFTRRYRAIELTDFGRRLLPGLSEGFNRLAESIDTATEDDPNRALMITCCTSFASRWLVPRLDQFRTLHPDIDVRLDATQRLVDLRHETFDFGIRFGPGEWVGVEADYLMDEEFIPVASPALLAKKPITVPSDLARHTLLHREDSPGPTPLDWRTWLQAAEVDCVDPERGLRYSIESMAIQAALDGHGVALVSNVLTQADLSAGRLVRLFDIGLPTGVGLAYYLAWRQRQQRQPRAMAFRNWILLAAEETAHLS